MMISPTESASSPKIPTVISLPSINCSRITSSSYLEASAIWSSSAGEFHPHALTQRYVNLSIHTAPIVQSWLEE